MPVFDFIDKVLEPILIYSLAAVYYITEGSIYVIAEIVLAITLIFYTFMKGIDLSIDLYYRWKNWRRSNADK